MEPNFLYAVRSIPILAFTWDLDGNMCNFPHENCTDVSSDMFLRR